MKPRAAVFFLGAVLLGACGGQTAERLPPTGQIVLYVTTDAPLPAAPGEHVDPSEPPALFDRLRIDVFAPGTDAPCQDCSREFELDRLRVRDGEANFGIAPRAGVTGYVARARLYRAITVKGGEPPPLSTIDVFAAIPEVSEEGIVRATLALRVKDLGHPVGNLLSPSATLAGKPDFSQIGTWPGGARVPCAGNPGPGEACVPGGAYWLGNPALGFAPDGTDASETRLVVLSPFYVDLHEITVAQYRASGLAKLVDGSSVDPAIGPPEVPAPAGTKGALTPDDQQYFCDYSDAPFAGEHRREELALNCISWSAASAYCGALGKTLPSEAELEYLASGLRSQTFAWGPDAPECGDSVWGLGGVGYYVSFVDTCRPSDSYGGPKIPGTSRLDRLALAGGEVVDLIGNLHELTRDHWNRTTEPCWAGRSLLENPECSSVSPADGDQRTIKGGSWAFQAAPAAQRNFRSLQAPEPNPLGGFRCVRSAK